MSGGETRMAAPSSLPPLSNYMDRTAPRRRRRLEPLARTLFVTPDHGDNQWIKEKSRHNHVYTVSWISLDVCILVNSLPIHASIHPFTFLLIYTAYIAVDSHPRSVTARLLIFFFLLRRQWVDEGRPGFTNSLILWAEACASYHQRIDQ